MASWTANPAAIRPKAATIRVGVLQGRQHVEHDDGAILGGGKDLHAKRPMSTGPNPWSRCSSSNPSSRQ